jgi:hypothetical protein
MLPILENGKVMGKLQLDWIPSEVRSVLQQKVILSFL